MSKLTIKKLMSMTSTFVCLLLPPLSRSPSSPIHFRHSRTSKQFVECKWEDLSVGQVVRVFAEQTVPADILLLSTTSPEKTCFLDTAAIDGESNLKQKSIPPCFYNVEKVEESSFELQCDPPNDDIYSFCGRILLPSSPNPHPCDNNHVLLRGCVVRTTEYIDGLIVYAGENNEQQVFCSVLIH